MHAMIRDDNNLEYSMDVLYNTGNNTFELRFSGTRVPGSFETPVSHSIICSSYKEAVRRFVSNCRYYHVPEEVYSNVPSCEEEFFGLKKNTLYPDTITL